MTRAHAYCVYGIHLVGYWLRLHWAIRRNYRLRVQGRLPDQLFWADWLAGYWQVWHYTTLPRAEQQTHRVARQRARATHTRLRRMTRALRKRQDERTA